MTTQDLKNNRNEILEQMDFVGVHPSMRKEFMKTMVDFAEMGINESEDVCEFVNEIFNFNANRTKEWKGKTVGNSLRETMGAIEEAQGNGLKRWCPLRKEYV